VWKINKSTALSHHKVTSIAPAPPSLPRVPDPALVPRNYTLQQGARLRTQPCNHAKQPIQPALRFHDATKDHEKQPCAPPPPPNPNPSSPNQFPSIHSPATRLPRRPPPRQTQPQTPTPTSSFDSAESSEVALAQMGKNGVGTTKIGETTSVARHDTTTKCRPRTRTRNANLSSYPLCQFVDTSQTTNKLLHDCRRRQSPLLTSRRR
jgi:hypothetical protein